MKSIKALGTHTTPKFDVPKVNKIDALGISPKNKYGHFNEVNSITYYHTFLPYGDINKLVDEYNDPIFLKTHNETDLLIFYLLGSKNELYINITNRSDGYSKLLSSQELFEYEGYEGKMTFKKYVISNIIKDKKEAFLFTYDEILVAVNDAIADFKFVTSEHNSKQESKFTAPSQTLKYRVNLQEKGITKLLQEVNRTIAKMRAEEKHSYNEWIMSKADPYNYFGIHIINNRNFSSQDLKQLISQLKDYKKNMSDLKNGRIKSINEMKTFVESTLTAGGSMFKWFIDTPFFSLDSEQRKKYLEMYCTEEESAYAQFSISEGIHNGDIVAALFKTCSNKQDLFDIIICLEQEGKLFHLLNNLKFRAFTEVCSIITSVYMKYIKEGDMSKKYAEAIKLGRQILFDNRTFGNRNIEEFDTVHNKMKFTTDLNLFVKIGKGTIAAPLLSGMSTDDLQKSISCNPLDLISLTPIEDIEEYKMKAGEIYVVPACFVYFLYNEETWKTNILAAQVTLQIAFCLIGVGEIMAAVEAGSTIGVAYSAAGVGIDSAFALTLIPEFGKHHPVVTKYIHYAMWARLVTDFINVKGLTEDLNIAKAKKTNFKPEEYEAIIDGVKFIKGTQKVYKPLSIKVLSLAFPETILGLYAVQGGRKLLFYIEKAIESQKNVTIFFKGAEIYRGSKAEAKIFMENAVVIYKNEGQIAMENFFFAKQSSNEIRLLHSQTGETYVGALIKKPKNNREYYSYELHDLNSSLHYKKNWTVKEKDIMDKFECKVYLVKENGKNYYTGDFMVAPNLNTSLQANKTGLSDVSLGKTMYDDGFVTLQKDLGKEFDGIYGLYVKNSSYAAYGGESVNLTRFKKAMQGKPITEANIIEAVKQMTPYKWAKEKGFDKIELKTTMQEFDDLLGNINELKELKVIYHK